MTENEIIETHIEECIHRIEVIENFMHSNSDADKEKCSKNISVLTKINGLLQEIQQYRAIGTVEGCEKAIQSSMEYYNLMKEYKAKVDELEAIGTIEEFKALKEADMKGANRAVDEFANYLHKIAKENNGLRLSSETKSWTHPCIFDYLEEFKNEQTCKEET